MPDAPEPLLLQEEGHDAVFLVAVCADAVFVHVVQEIIVKVVHAALFQLLEEDLARVHRLEILMPRILVRETVRIPRISRKRLADGGLRLPAVVGLGGVKVIHAVREGVVHHRVHLRLIDVLLSAGARQTHRAEAEQAQPIAADVCIDHKSTSIWK